MKPAAASLPISRARPAGWRGASGRWLRANGFYVAMLSPLLLIMGALYVYPVARTVYTSFTNLNFLGTTPTAWIGLGNYRDYLGSSDGVATLRHTFVFTALVTLIETALGFALALLVNRLVLARGLVRTLLLLPLMFAPVVAGYEWRWIFDDQLGLANYLLQELGFIDRPLAWLTSPALAMWTIIVADVWYSTPFIMIILLGGLQALPVEPFEAAKVDGAGAVATLWHVTIPLLRPVLLAAILIRAMDAFQIFDLPFIMTYGGPGGATETVNTWTYKTAFHDFRMGYAAAVSIVALVAMLLIGAFLARVVIRQIGYRESAG
jgi:ABC-type sugar transport system permease subunit